MTDEADAFVRRDGKVDTAERPDGAEALLDPPTWITMGDWDI
jgi:hypothetical protein